MVAKPVVQALFDLMRPSYLGPRFVKEIRHLFAAPEMKGEQDLAVFDLVEKLPGQADLVLRILRPKREAKLFKAGPSGRSRRAPACGIDRLHRRKAIATKLRRDEKG